MDVKFKFFVLQMQQLIKNIGIDNFAETEFHYGDDPYTANEILEIKVEVSEEDYKTAIVEQCNFLSSEEGQFNYGWANYYSFDEMMHMNCYIDEPTTKDYTLSKEEVFKIANLKTK